MIYQSHVWLYIQRQWRKVLEVICTLLFRAAIIQSSQKLETTQVLVDGWTDKQNLVYTYNRILFSLKNSDKCCTMNESWRHYAKLNKPFAENRKILYNTTYMWWLEKSNSKRQTLSGSYQGPGARICYFIHLEFLFYKMKKHSGNWSITMLMSLTLVNCVLKSD